MLSPQEINGLETAFAKTLTLFQKNRNAESWSDNIIHGSTSLKTQAQWTQYQAWLANPELYDLANPVADVDVTSLKIPAYPPNLEVSKFQNGSETIVHVVNKSLYVDEVEDEKCPE